LSSARGVTLLRAEEVRPQAGPTPIRSNRNGQAPPTSTMPCVTATPRVTCIDRLIARRRTMDFACDIDTREVLACDEAFFIALLAADHELLGTILADDFLIIDVLSGQVARREELLGAISSGQLRFAELTRCAGERPVRLRASAAVVAGRT